MTVHLLSPSHITTTINISDSSLSQDTSANEADPSRHVPSSSHTDEGDYITIKGGGDSPEKPLEIRMQRLRFHDVRSEDHAPPPVAPRGNLVPEGIRIPIPKRPADADAVLRTSNLSISLDGKRSGTPIPPSELDAVPNGRKASDDLNLRRFSDGNLPGTFSSDKKISSVLEVLATPRDYSKPTLPPPIDSPPASPTSPRDKPKKESPRKGSWPPFLTLMPTYKMGAHSPRLMPENSTIHSDHSLPIGCGGILVQSLASSSTSGRIEKVPDEEWSYIAKLPTATLRYDIDKAVRQLHKCFQNYPAATGDLLDRLSVLHELAEKKRITRWNEFVYKFFVNIDSPEKVPFFSSVLKRTRMPEADTAKVLFEKGVKAHRSFIDWIACLHLDHFCNSEEREPYFQNLDTPPFAIALFNCYIARLGDHSLKKVVELLSREMRSSSIWSGERGIPYAFLDVVLQQLCCLDYPSEFKRAFVELREKLSLFSTDHEDLRKKVGLIFLEGVVHPHLKEKIPAGIARRETIILQIMQALHSLLSDVHLVSHGRSSSVTAERFYAEGALPFQNLIDHLSIGAYMKGSSGTDQLKQFFTEKFSHHSIDVGECVHYIVGYLNENPSHERYVVRELVKCFQTTYASHASTWNTFIAALAFQKTHINFFNALSKECLQTINLLDLAEPLGQLLTQTEPINALLIVRDHLSFYMATQNLGTFCRESRFATLLLSEYGQYLAKAQFVQFSEYLDTAILTSLGESMALSRSRGEALDPQLLTGAAEAVLAKILQLPFTNDFKALVQLYRSELKSFLQRQPELNPELVKKPRDKLFRLEEIRKLEEKYLRSLIFLYIVNPYLVSHYAETSSRAAATALSKELQSLANAVEGELPSSDDPRVIASHQFCQKNLSIVTAFLYHLSVDSTSSSSSFEGIGPS